MFNKKNIYLGIILILFVTTVFAEEYYADVEFDVANNGSVTISGTANHPNLQNTTAQNFTLKEKEI